MNLLNIVDRKTYPHKGTWRNPDQDVDYVFFYYFINPMSLQVQTQYGRETVKPTAVIGVAGNHPFVKGDVLTLHNGMELQVQNITFNYFDGNIRIRELLLPRVREMVVELA